MGQLRVPATSHPEVIPNIHWTAGLGPRAIWTFQRTQKSLAPGRNGTPYHTAHNLVTTPKTPSWLLALNNDKWKIFMNCWRSRKESGFTQHSHGIQWRKGRKSWPAKLIHSKSEDTTQCHNWNLETENVQVEWRGKISPVMWSCENLHILPKFKERQMWTELTIGGGYLRQHNLRT